MSKVSTVQTNFTAGEVSPKCFGRTDVARYQNGAEILENCVVNVHGGVERRPGTLFEAETKNSAKRSILIPYVFSVTQAYMLEFGDFYMRVYVAGGGQVLSSGTPYEISTPYSESMLDALDYTQGADTMFIFHPAVQTHTLKRFAADRWVISSAPFTVSPFDAIGHRYSANITVSNTTIGSGRTATASGSTFLPADVGRRITYNGGSADITAYTSGTAVTIRITSEFPTASLPANEWVLEDSPQGQLQASKKGPVGSGVILSLQDGSAAALDGFRSSDIGKFVRINNGLVRITSFVSADQLGGRIVKELSNSDAAAPANAWSLESSVWNSRNGYPSTGCLYEQRLTVAGTPSAPQTVWGSKSALPYDFTIGTDDDDAFSFAIPTTGQINPILHLVAAEALLPLTYGGEYTMEGGVEKPLAPTNVRLKPRTAYGAKKVKPVKVGGEVLFVQRSGRKVRALSYAGESGTYSAPDLTVLAEHITESGIVAMAYQQEPRSLLWCVRADGVAACMTIDREEGVLAWTRNTTEGDFESVASIPGAAGDELWVIVRREFGGVTKRYVERFSEDVLADCGIVGVSDPGAEVWGGLDHLEGGQVEVIADGAHRGLYTVTAGSITLNRPAFEVKIGLPYTTRIKLLRPEIQTGEGSAQGAAMSTHQIQLLLLQTVGGKVNGDPLKTRTFGSDLLDKPPTEYTGFKGLGTTGWEKGKSDIEITQEVALPFHLLAVVRKWTVNQ